ncbi:hypothetical protein LR48_Vigan07g051600 [Vigna angularis]|uniref:PGG domain-containing protein n=1 Tax=Phaseolus angularis TaxID=3914 RepID=A0A0L9UW46_PHAAN|nr:hypothetical protein LR48_Vigan07g051600 [Vigna angularis]
MNPENFEEELSYNSSYEVSDYLAEYTLEGKWEKVVNMYNRFPACHTTMINESVGTALHVAVDLDEEVVVHDLVNAIIGHSQGARVKALEMENDGGDTPLHVAASRGFVKICKWIIGTDKERIYLVSRRNKHGETPLFGAAINWKKQAFAYLSNLSDHSAPLQDLVRDNDLAVIIVHYYDFLSTHKNIEGFTPLKLLASRPSAFRSATNLSWWKRILYHWILIEPLNPEKQMKANLGKIRENPKSDKEKNPKNYATLHDFFSGSFNVAALFGKMPTRKNKYDIENPSSKRCTFELGTPKVGFLPPNYETSQQFLWSAYVHILGLSGVELKEIKKTKKRHQWSGQLLKALLKRPYAAFTGSGGVPMDMKVETDMYNVYSEYKQVELSELRWLEEENETDVEKKGVNPSESVKKESDEQAEKGKTDKKETAFLVAARNGIVEMVEEMLYRIPSVIHNTNSKKENVLLVAVRNRQPLVVESLKTKMQSKLEVWNNLTLTVDEDENTMLHLAAYAPGRDKPWQIAGSALQTVWDITWFQYIKSLVPRHFYFRSDKKGKNAGEIFEETHKKLIKESGEWLKDTSESCSVVAALVAAASFTAANTIPGGSNDKGRPNLESEAAFHAFAIASLIGLCFSVTGLIMFLTILTSRKQPKDFRRGLPLKLLLGLSSLFVSIAAMFVSFCTGHFFLLCHGYEKVLYPIYAATVFPVTFYAVAQFPLYFDLLMAILTKVPRSSDRGEKL